MEQIFPFKINSFLKYLFISLFLMLIDLIFPLTFIKETSLVIVSPLNWGIKRTSENFQEMIKLSQDLTSIIEENKDLRGDLSALRVKLVDYDNLQKENDFLRKELEIEDEKQYPHLLAEVRGWQMDSFGRKIIINKGKNDGVEIGMPMVANGYLLGKVVGIGEKNAQVEVITSTQSSIPAAVFKEGEREKILGIIEGEFGVGLRLKQVSQDALIEEGDLVLTSGKGGTLPAKFILGKIREVFQGQNEVYKQAKVSPLVNFEDLDKIFIILQTEY